MNLSPIRLSIYSFYFIIMVTIQLQFFHICLFLEISCQLMTGLSVILSAASVQINQIY